MDFKSCHVTKAALLVSMAMAMSACASDSIRSSPNGRQVSIALNFHRNYYSAQMYNELRRDVGGLAVSTYFLVVEAPGDVRPVVKIDLGNNTSTFREVQFKSEARNLTAKIRLECGDEVKETKPLTINLPVGDCTVFLKYFGRMDDRKKYHATELISVVSDITEK